MKKSILKQLLVTTILILFSSSLWGADGDTFRSGTIEGVELTYKVISESEKTCQVGDGNVAYLPTPQSYSGSITIPSNANGYLVIGIGDYAFNSFSLSSVTIPNGIKTIGNYAFQSCHSLTSITLPASVTNIGYNAFYYCSSLSTISISEGVVSIGNCAFWGCTSLTSITIPSSVTKIGDYVFNVCYRLTSVSLSSIITSIGKGAFQACGGLTSITIPNSVKSIGESAFYGCI